MRRICYLAGPGGKNPPRSVRMKYWAAADTAKRAGYLPLNPTVLPGALPREIRDRICHAMLDQACEIVCLEGWERCETALADVDYGARQGLVLRQLHELEEEA